MHIIINRCGGEICAIGITCVIARCDGGANTGISVDTCGYNGNCGGIFSYEIRSIV